MNKLTWTKTSFAGLIQLLTFALLSTMIALPATAGPREQAKRIHDRLAGVPPADTVLDSMETAIVAGDPGAAAEIAMNDVNFYNVTLKNFASPWTNRDQSIFVPLNDYVATVIGMVRDDVPFNTLLSADLTYVGANGVVASPPSASNNDHFAQLEADNINLRDNLVAVPQSTIIGIPSTATAGIMTSRAASEAFFIAGTNRAMFRFTLLNHMCNDMEQMHDPKLAPDRIRQDVSRSPGGDSRLFLNNCIGCHTGMDPMAGAFAYYNYDENSGALEYTAGTVQPKYFNNDLNFPQGYRTTDDHWQNYWRRGQNAYLEFDPSLPGEGNGAKSLGQELGNSGAFAACQVKKVFRTVCLRDAENAADRAAVDAMTAAFQSVDPISQDTHRLKTVFASSAVHCMGQ
ncbi:MAG: hypothetical protein HKN77_00985 [Woeseiaceae bacterium]|nr:hypothetical protein [Woeseiaceae bacterium]